GWSGANYVAWNCRGSLVCQKPPTAQNYAFGHVGEKRPGHFARKPGQAEKYGIQDGHWESPGRPMQPRSLYLKQLEDRLGSDSVNGL
ncbi:MAG: hypothetical protein QF886_22700, partial [Planctomycetota bacterium]|nr:hypothetical protein [Planctomycetota bacterium]